MSNTMQSTDSTSQNTVLCYTDKCILWLMQPHSIGCSTNAPTIPCSGSIAQLVVEAAALGRARVADQRKEAAHSHNAQHQGLSSRHGFPLGFFAFSPLVHLGCDAAWVVVALSLSLSLWVSRLSPPDTATSSSSSCPTRCVLHTVPGHPLNPQIKKDRLGISERDLGLFSLTRLLLPRSW